MSPTDVQLANLKPNPGGEVRNPHGHNQYSYRQDFEATVDSLLAGKPKHQYEPIDAEEGKKIACILCGLRKSDVFLGSQRYAHESCVKAIEGKTRGQVIGEVTVRLAMCGDERVLPEILKRLWPAVKEVDLRVPGSDPTALYDGVAEFFARRGSAGADPEPAGERTNGNGGVAP